LPPPATRRNQFDLRRCGAFGAHQPSIGPRRADQGAQATDNPFVRLKVSAAQNAAALRYQTW
jgi:hypothetical protein